MLTDFARALGGAIIFTVPLLMTMEMWRLAVAVDPWRFAMLITAGVALVVGLARSFGLRSGTGWGSALVDAGLALVAGALAVGIVLSTFSVIDVVSDWRGATSIIALETIPAAVGAAFARSQLGQGSAGSVERSGYFHELFLMAAGAVVFASSVAPTEEVILLAGKLSDVGALVLAILSLTLMHAFVYSVGFKGTEGEGGLGEFFLFTIPGYVVVLAVAAFMLWALGGLGGIGLRFSTVQVLVLAFPASVGAAAARLIL